jgi:serine/threonine-protein kinase
MALPRIGDTLDGKYRIDAFIGKGNIGVVARARHLLRDADVALKFLRAHEGDEATRQEIAERFRLEAIASSRLATQHVVQIHDVGETPEGSAYLVMEHLVGEDLETLLRREKRLSTARALHIVLQAARALSVAHAAGVVHRDLKPGNIFLTEADGEQDFVKLLDFGISKITAIGEANDALRLTSDDVGMGTPLYMAPEQARDARGVTPASDLYSLAAVLYECIAGEPPLDAGSTIELFYKLVHTTPKRLDVDFEVPKGLADAVATALEKDPADRQASMEAFAAALAPFADGRSERALVSLRLTPRGSISLPPIELSADARRPLSGTHFAHDVSPDDEDELLGLRPKRTRWELGLAIASLLTACVAGGTYLSHHAGISAVFGASAVMAPAPAPPPPVAVSAVPVATFAGSPSTATPPAAPAASSVAAVVAAPTTVAVSTGSPSTPRKRPLAVRSPSKEDDRAAALVAPTMLQAPQRVVVDQGDNPYGGPPNDVVDPPLPE